MVTGLLEEWARSHLPGFEAVRLVGEEWSAHSDEIRDLLDRNGIPFSSYPAEAEQGKALLERAGVAAATLPVIILYDGRVLEQPSNTEVAEALGEGPGRGRPVGRRGDRWTSVGFDSPAKEFELIGDHVQECRGDIDVEVPYWIGLELAVRCVLRELRGQLGVGFGIEFGDADE